MIYVILMGGPGAGKGTQAKRLEKTLQLYQIATGDLFRENLKEETELGRLAQGYMNKGELVPDSVTVAMVRERLSCLNGAPGVLLDGFPRTLAQAHALDALLSERAAKINVVPYIKVDPDVLLQRLSGRWTCKVCGHVYHTLFDPPKEDGVCDIDGGTLYQREDDTEETQKRRIEVYFEQTSPLLDHYHERGLVVEIDGEQPIEQVYHDLVQAIQGVIQV